MFLAGLEQSQQIGGGPGFSAQITNF